MSEQTIKFNNVVVSKKEFHASKQAIALSLVDPNEIVVSDKFKYRNNGSKYFIGYLDDDDDGDDDIIRPLCIISRQMSGYTKHFDDSGKICLSKLKMKVCFLNIMKFGTKLKRP